LVRLIPFLLILVVIEEILPLVVLYAPFMLPSTCVLPSQQERILLKQRERVQMYAASNGSNFQRILIRGNSSALNIPLEELVTREERLAMCGYG
jgi:LETM1 and EF-hand domain-containing protein 1